MTNTIENDVVLSLKLLTGLDINDTHAEPRYILNEPQERTAREALARIIRRRIPGWVGEFLALAIDLRTSPQIPGVDRTLKVNFTNDTSGPGSKWARNQRAYAFMKEEFKKGAKPKQVYSDACKRFAPSLRPNAMQKVWLERKKQDAIWGTTTQ